MKRIKVPYLTALPERVQQLRRRIRCNGKLTCGLSWISKNADIGADKSLHLQNLKSILTLPSIDFVNLQYGDTTEEQATLWNKCGLTLKNVPDVDNFSDIDGLATLIEACDVVVTVSNTTAHLAAALGKRVYLMLPFSTGLLWYWHVNRTSTPWYPTVKLFRQPAMGDWSSVIDQVRQELTRL